MTLSDVSTKILDQLYGVVQEINAKDFVRPCSSLMQASIGQHLRHTVEFFLCLEEGFVARKVNYDNRAHDHNLETNKVALLETIIRIKQFVNNKREDFQLELEVSYSLNETESIKIKSFYLRELIYNIEHAVHHMAMIKIGIKEIAPYVSLPFDFGISNSTVRYRKTQSLS